METLFDLNDDSPIICSAIHNGHKLRKYVTDNLGLSEELRFFEEDPLTDFFTAFSQNQIIQLTSRFEYDVNRNPEKCIYQKPKDCWNLEIFPYGISPDEIKVSQDKYQLFYDTLKSKLEMITQKQNNTFIWDIHSYNNRNRKDITPNSSHTDIKNEIRYLESHVPDICLGLSNIDDKFTDLIIAIANHFAQADFFGQNLSVAYNHPFSGGYYPQWINHYYGDKVCALSIELNKRIFMKNSTFAYDESDMSLNIQKAYRLREIFTDTFDIIQKYM